MMTAHVKAKNRPEAAWKNFDVGALSSRQRTAGLR